MILRKLSPFTKKWNGMKLPISSVEYVAWCNAQDAGLKPRVQDFFPKLSPEQREFMRTGITPEEWNNYIGEEK